MRLLCLTVKPDGGVMSPVLTRLGFVPYNFSSVFQGYNIRYHPTEWESLLLGKKNLQDIRFLKDYDCIVGAPGTILYDQILQLCPPYTKVILIIERDKIEWATTYEQFLKEFFSKPSIHATGRLSHARRVQQQFYSLVEHMTVGSGVEKESHQGQSRTGKKSEGGATQIGRISYATLSESLSLSVRHRALALEQFEQRVRRTVDRKRLLVYDPSQGWDPLCKFLGVEKIPSSIRFPSINSLVSNPGSSTPFTQQTAFSKAQHTVLANDLYGLSALHILEDRFARAALLYRLLKWFLAGAILFFFQSYVVMLWNWSHLTYKEYQEAYIKPHAPLSIQGDKK